MLLARVIFAGNCVGKPSKIDERTKVNGCIFDLFRKNMALRMQSMSYQVSGFAMKELHSCQSLYA